MATNEYDIVQGRVKRQRGLVDALTQQSMTPTQGGMVGQVYVGPGLLDALSKPLMAIGASYANEGLDKEELSNSQNRQAALVDALSKMQNQPGTPGFTTEGLGSNFEELQKAGLMNLQAQLSPKNVETFGTPVKNEKGELVQYGNRGTVKPTGTSGYQAPLFVRGEAVDPNNIIPGEHYGTTPGGNTVNLPPQEKARDKEVGTGEGKTITAAREQRMGAQRMFTMASRLEELDQDGILSGPTAKPLAFAGQLATGLGIQLSPEISKLLANTENFDVTVGKEISNMVLNSAAGRGFTDTDREYVVRAFPGMMQTPQGRKDAITFMKDASVRGSKEGKMIEDAIKAGNYDQLDLTGGKMSQYEQSKGLKPGTVQDGYIYQGGDPSNPASWSKQ